MRLTWEAERRAGTDDRRFHVCMMCGRCCSAHWSTSCALPGIAPPFVAYPRSPPSPPSPIHAGRMRAGPYGGRRVEGVAGVHPSVRRDVGIP